MASWFTTTRGTEASQHFLYLGDLPIVLTVDTHVQDVGVPFVFSYLSDHVPYSLEIAAYDDDKGKVTVTLFIDDLSIVYPDGRAVQVISPMDKWTQDFQRYSPASLCKRPPTSHHLG